MSLGARHADAVDRDQISDRLACSLVAGFLRCLEMLHHFGEHARAPTTERAADYEILTVEEKIIEASCAT